MTPRGSLTAMALFAVLARPVAAQERALVLFVQGGHHNPLSGLIEDGVDELRPGLSLGGGLALMLGPSVALRGYVSRVQSDYVGDALLVQDSSVTRVFLGGDLLFGTALEIGIAPYVFGGVGGVRVDPGDPDLASFTRFQGRAGAGVNYVVENSRLTPFVEGSVWFYDFNGFGFDTSQTDFAIMLGMALTIPF